VGGNVLTKKPWRVTVYRENGDVYMTEYGQGTNPNRLTESDIIAYEEVRQLWEKVMRGGTIVCKTPGKAINLRQRMYRYRRKVQGTNGATPYDDMIIKLERGDNRLYVTKRDEGILEIIPDLDNIEIAHEPETIIAARKRPTDPIIPEG
jgi:hypothetical protein